MLPFMMHGSEPMTVVTPESSRTRAGMVFSMYDGTQTDSHGVECAAVLHFMSDTSAV